MTNWFISVNGEQKGPYPTDQLRQLVSDGFVARDAYVWREGMAQWQPLSQVRISDDGPAPSPQIPQARDAGQGQQFQQSQSFAGQQQNGYAMDSASYVKPGYFSFYGRISRKTFWLSYVLLAFVVMLGASIVVTGLFSVLPPDHPAFIGVWIVLAILYIALIVASLSAQVKRLHDRGRSGWFVLLSLVPIANIWIFIEVAFLKGTTGPNDFGPDPLG